jgi:hypothetical protein
VTASRRDDALAARSGRRSSCGTPVVVPPAGPPGVALARDVAIFSAALELFDAVCIGSGIEAFAKLAKTLRDWRA